MSNDAIIPGFDEDTPKSLTIRLQRVERADNCLTLKLTGQIDTYSASYFQRSAKKAIEAGFTNLILVLKDVDYVSSMGVGSFIQLQKAARERGGDLAMVDIHPKVAEILKLMCLEKFFSCTDSVDEAIVPMKSKGKVPTFPKTLACPICEKKLRAAKPGQFRCPECRTVLAIDGSGRLFLG